MGIGEVGVLRMKGVWERGGGMDGYLRGLGGLGRGVEGFERAG